MLRISKMADYGTVIMGCLARAQQRLSAAQVAEKTRISQPTVMKLLKLLSEASLVRSLRGSQGGYQLALRPEQVTVAAMVSAIDGAPAITECGGENSCCAHESYCGLKGNWQKINHKITEVLEGVTLKDL